MGGFPGVKLTSQMESFLVRAAADDREIHRKVAFSIKTQCAGQFDRYSFGRRFHIFVVLYFPLTAGD